MYKIKKIQQSIMTLDGCTFFIAMIADDEMVKHNMKLLVESDAI